jgi:hypothetical protein
MMTNLQTVFAFEEAFEIGEMCAPLYATRDFVVFHA